MAIFSSFPIRELTSMMAPMFVTSFVVLTASSPLETDKKEDEYGKEEEKIYNCFTDNERESHFGI